MTLHGRKSLSLAVVVGAVSLAAVVARFFGAGSGTSDDASANWSVNITRSTDTARQTARPIDDPAEQNGMQTFLLDSTEDNRAQVFRLAILDAGYVCQEVNTARLVGSDGMSWRTTCDAGNAYWVNVEESGRLQPMPVLNFDSFEIGNGSGSVPVAPPIPAPGADRTLRLEFERDRLELEQRLQENR